MASAAISAGASILGGIAGGKGARKAAKIQAAAYQKGLDQQAAQFQQTQQNFAPYLQAGNKGLASYLDLLDQNDGDVKSQAISQLQQSPQFTSLSDQGADTILQNASATGGLRGGNTQNSLAQFGSGLLNQVIQQQLGNYGGLISTGSGATGQIGQLGAQNSAQASQLLAQQGGAQGAAAAAPYAAFQGIMNQLGGQSGSWFGNSRGAAMPYGSGTYGGGPNADGTMSYRGW